MTPPNDQSTGHQPSVLADKRVDHFAAGTLLVWDVDLSGGSVNVYRASRPDAPDVFRRGDHTDAEPAVRGAQ